MKKGAALGVPRGAAIVVPRGAALGTPMGDPCWTIPAAVIRCEFVTNICIPFLPLPLHEAPVACVASSTPQLLSPLLTACVSALLSLPPAPPRAGSELSAIYLSGGRNHPRKVRTADCGLRTAEDRRCSGLTRIPAGRACSSSRGRQLTSDRAGRFALPRDRRTRAASGPAAHVRHSATPQPPHIAFHRVSLYRQMEPRGCAVSRAVAASARRCLVLTFSIMPAAAHKAMGSGYRHVFSQCQ